ncbi:MAG: hypothetical protein AAB686_00800, partial [Patescibacteria group bacterium]
MAGLGYFRLHGQFIADFAGQDRARFRLTLNQEYFFDPHAQWAEPFNKPGLVGVGGITGDLAHPAAHRHLLAE